MRAKRAITLQQSAALAPPQWAGRYIDRPASSKNACTASNSINRFFSMMMVCVP
jgi:hypothetical protein